MNACLEIPQLGSAPRTWSTHRPNALAARTALALLDAGHIEESHRPLTNEPAELVKAGLKTWLAGNARDLKLFNFTLNCYAGEATPGTTYHPGKKNEIAIDIGAGDQVRALTIGRRICMLPQALAETALFWIGEASRATLPIYTPADALDYVSYCHWQGEDDEKEAVAQITADGGTATDYEMLTRAQFDKAIPTWASKPRQRVPVKTIKALASSSRSGPDVRIGRAIFTLIGALAEYRKRIDIGFDPSEESFLFPQPVGLFWRGTTGIMGRIFDDFAEDVSNSGEYRQYFAAQQIEDGSRFGIQIQTFLRGVEPMFPILRTLETLLLLITDKDHGK